MTASRLLLLVIGLPLCGLAAVHDYHLTIDPGISEVSVEARLNSAEVLRARNGRAASVSGLMTCDARPLRMRDDTMVLSNGVDCIRYRHPLVDATANANQQGSMRRPEVAQGIVVASPGRWLWLPALAPQDRVQITLTLPPGIVASVPWRQRADGIYELLASPRSSHAVAVFGKFSAHSIAIPGASLRVALVDGPRTSLSGEPTATKILTWLAAAAQDVAAVSAAFPNPAPQVIVQPAPRTAWGESRSPVPFGYVIRDGGESVRFFIDAGQGLPEFLRDWTATHEFSHLLLPYVRSEEKWISEGFASYYQNVLLARRGIYTEQDAWRRLHRSFRRAAEIPDPPLLQNIDDRPFWEMRMLVYWSGAAIALMADAELRRLSGGHDSLDAVLGRLRECCLPSGRAWRGRELFAKLDELSSTRIFLELFDKHSTRRGMPDMAQLYRDLGIVAGIGSDAGVSLRDAAPLAGIRRSIMQANE